MIEVSFKFPEELDLAFYYLDKQFQRFIEEEIVLPEHKISIGEDELSILMWYEDDDEDNDDRGPGDDPIWPIEPVPPTPTGYQLEIEPNWVYNIS